MSHVDDVLTFGPQDSADCFFEERSKKLLMKHLGELQTNRREIASLGRLLRRRHEGVHLLAPKACAGDDQLIGT